MLNIVSEKKVYITFQKVRVATMKYIYYIHVKSYIYSNYLFIFMDTFFFFFFIFPKSEIGHWFVYLSSPHYTLEILMVRDLST